MPINNKDKSLETMKTKLENFEFDFQEGMWNDMEAQLDAQDGASRIGWKKFLLYILPITALLIADFYFLTGGNSFQNNTVVTTVLTPSFQEDRALESKSQYSVEASQEETGVLSEHKTAHSAATTSKITANSTATTTSSKEGLPTKSGLIKDESSRAAHQNNNRPFSSQTKIAPTKMEFTPEGISSNNQVKKDQEILLDQALTLPTPQEVQDKEHLIEFSITNTLPKKNSTSFILQKEKYQNIPTVLAIQKPIFIRKKNIGIIGGLNSTYLSGGENKMKIGGFFGLRYRKSINQRLSFGVSLTFNRTNLGESLVLSYADTLVTPRGWSTTSDTRKISSIMYLESTIDLHYQLPALKSSIKIGLRPSYNLGFDESISTSNSSTGSARISSETTQEYISVLRDNNHGIRKISLGISLGYEYQFSPSWSASLDYRHGLIDLSRDAFLRNNQEHKNSYLQIGASYWIF